MLRYFAFLIVTLVSTGPLLGQVGDPLAGITKAEPPQGQLLKCPPSMADWVVNINYDDAKSAPNPVPADPTALAYIGLRPKSVQTTKTNEIVHERTIDQNGGSKERWFVGRVQYEKPPTSKKWYLTEPSTQKGIKTSDTYAPLPPCGFRDMEWVTSSTFAGILKYGGKDCLVFAQKTVDPEDRDALTSGAIAYIDSESRLPIAMRIGGTTRVYQFNPPPAQMLSLPGDLGLQLRQTEEARARLLQAAPRPY